VGCGWHPVGSKRKVDEKDNARTSQSLCGDRPTRFASHG
jgi:hypothetical protein